MRLRTFGGLWIESADAEARAAPRPRRLALLAILAAAGAKGLSRDVLLGVLWPDSEPDRARHALSQTLYSLRRDLGADVILTGTELRLDPERITSDIDDFQSAISTGDLSRAAALYTAPFLDGFYLSAAPEFERWVESERSHLARDGARAIESAARLAGQQGDRERAAVEWERLTVIDPLNTHFASSYMEAKAKLGDRAGALAHGLAHADRVRRDLDTDPDPSFAQLVARLREGGRAIPEGERAADSRHTQQSAPTELAPVTPITLAAPSSAGVAIRRWRRATVPVLIALAVVAVGWRALAAFRAEAPQPVLAVGQVRDLVTPDSAQLGGVLSEMLATSLGRLTDLQVIANSRILELTPRGADTARAARTDAARRAGATEVLEGELSPMPDKQLRLDLRRIDIDRGMVRRGYQIIGSDRLAMFDSMTVLVANDLRLMAPTGTLAEVSTRSPIAYRLYEDGLRAFFQYDAYAASRLFREAIQEDSTFAMATYYAWRSAVAINAPSLDTLGNRAVLLASRASDRDRLLILTHVGATRSDLRALAAAESLAMRFPNDPEALVRAAEVIPDLTRATALMNRAIAIDSAAVLARGVACRMCDALAALYSRYDWADSVAGAQSTLERWSRLRPADAAPWLARADYLIGLGRRTEANAALRRAGSLGGRMPDPNERALLWAMRTDDFESMRETCRTQLASTDSETFLKYRWYCAIALRMQGKYRDALSLIRDGRAPGSGVVHRGLPRDSIGSAILDMEMGRPLAAARQFSSFKLPVDPTTSSGLKARMTTWALTRTATAYAAAGDTLNVRALVDTIESAGRQSLFARDPVLHFFVRGLLFAQAEEHETAVTAFRAALVSPSQGYTRINYELARSLLVLNRPAEAIPLMRAPLHGGLEGSGLYLTRTEAHELLARAFDASGQRDSAAVHYAIVERAWRNADPILAPRYQAARQWLAARGEQRAER